jgi:hypothetical protein
MVRITPLIKKKGEIATKILQNQGWQVQQGDNSFTATRQDVNNQSEIRHELFKMGLLLCGGLRIEFS